MENVILVVHILVCIGLIGVVLLQRSEGGALGMGGGGGGGLMSGRGAASALTRTTMILAAIFFATSLVLTTLATRSTAGQRSLGETAAEEEFQDLEEPGNSMMLPDDLGSTSESAPASDVPDDLSAPATDTVPQEDVPSDLDPVTPE